jgi:hypothetical protein
VNKVHVLGIGYWEIGYWLSGYQGAGKPVVINATPSISTLPLGLKWII